MSCCWCILKMIALIAFLERPSDSANLHVCVCELREWSDRGAGDAEVRLRETGCLVEQPQSDCVMLGLISTGVVALRDF